MTIYEKEFYRRGLSWGNHVAWTLRFDTDSGQMRVRVARSSKADWKNEDVSLGDFMKSGNHRARSVLKHTLSSLISGAGLVEVDAAARKLKGPTSILAQASS